MNYIVRKEAYILNMYTLPEYRGNGLAKNYSNTA